MANEGYTTCSDCHRLLRTEDGPTCPGCLEQRTPAEPEPVAPTNQ